MTALKLSNRLIESLLLGLTALITGAVNAVPSATFEVVAPTLRVEAYEEKIESSLTETLEEKINRVQAEHNLKRNELYNLAFSESTLGENRVGDEGKSCGVIHFHKDYYPEENSRCGDDEYILNRAAEMISEGEGWQFVPGNCYAYAEVLTEYRLPRMIDIVPNEVYPRVGSIAIFRYTNNKHIAVISKVTEDGIWIKEANFEPYKIGTRLIKFDDPNLKGFFRP